MTKDVNKRIGKVKRAIVVSSIINITLVIIKIVVGILGQSKALIADGIHSFSDLITDAIALIGNNMSKKPADSKHPYGHGKSEYLTSLFIGMFIILLGIFLINEMINGKITKPNLFVIIVILFTIVAKLILSRFMIIKGTKYENNILIASGKESAADVYSSIIVLISSVAMQFISEYQWLKYSDKVASVIIGVLIIKIGFNIVKENASMMLGEQVVDEKYLDEIRKIILNNEYIIAINELIILKYGPYFKLISEVSMKKDLTLLEAHDKIDEIEDKLREYDGKIGYITIHMCPYLEEENS